MAGVDERPERLHQSVDLRHLANTAQLVTQVQDACRRANVGVAPELQSPAPPLAGQLELEQADSSGTSLVPRRRRFLCTERTVKQASL